MNKFYVYEWYVIDTGVIFYVGKGFNNRYKEIKGSRRSIEFMNIYNSCLCDVRKILEGLSEEEAYNQEKLRIGTLSEIGQAFCNIQGGGRFGGDTFSRRTKESKDLTRAKVSIAGKLAHAINPERAITASNKMKEMRANPDKTLKNREVCRERMLRLNKDPNFRKSTKSVKCIETNIIYSSIKEAALSIGTSPTFLSTCILNSKSCKGHTFLRVEL